MGVCRVLCCDRLAMGVCRVLCCDRLAMGVYRVLCCDRLAVGVCRVLCGDRLAMGVCRVLRCDRLAMGVCRVLCSTCFGCQPHPSSVVHKTVTAASVTGHIFFFAATSLQRGQVSLTTLEGGSCTVPEAVVTVLCITDDGCG